MKTVGIRELRQQASKVLREVEGGETFEITDRGRPVARLTPVPVSSPLEQLRAAGETSGPPVANADFPEPLTLPDGMESPSVVLERLRADER